MKFLPKELASINKLKNLKIRKKNNLFKKITEYY